VVINKTPITEEIDLIERVLEEVINKPPTTDEIDLIEREQEEVINDFISGKSFVNVLFLFSFY
jgi:hypothetical protein